MHLPLLSSNGPTTRSTTTSLPIQSPSKPYQIFRPQASTLPFTQPLPLADISGPTYLTAQALVIQTAHQLSAHLWSFSPPSFALDAALIPWIEAGELNAFGVKAELHGMQLRGTGAGNALLGYVVTRERRRKNERIPHAIIATSAALQHLRGTLDELVRRGAKTDPVVLHIAAVEFGTEVAAAGGVVADYVAVLRAAEDGALGVLVSSSVHEAQHMAMLATILARWGPFAHVWDGAAVGSETARVADALSGKRLRQCYEAVLQHVEADQRKRSDEVRVMRALQSLNQELGTEYAPFEYDGHEQAESVMVVFGSVESSLGAHVAAALARNGAKMGVVKVRVYRPFVEEAFLNAIPKSVKAIGVLGQVLDRWAVADPSIPSVLYGDVVAAFAFTEDRTTVPKLMDLKYPRSQVWTPVSMAAAFQMLSPKPVLQDERGRETLRAFPFSSDLETMKQYVFWDLIDSEAVSIPFVLGKALSQDPTQNVTIRTTYDHLMQGGAQRVDLRSSKITVEAPFPIDAADVVFVGNEVLLEEVDVLAGIRGGGKLVLRLPGLKIADLEKRLGPVFRKTLKDRSIELLVLDPHTIESVANDSTLEPYLCEQAFLRAAYPGAEEIYLRRVAAINGNEKILADLGTCLEKALVSAQLPEAWTQLPADIPITKLPSSLRSTGFAPVAKTDEELSSSIHDWHAAAKGLLFKEAFETKPALRPDLAVRTFTVHVCENRRLTPLTYDRNIFHIEFDLGDSGLTYQIGEALGIHPENDASEVDDFIRFYGLEASEVLQIPSREDASVVESRTVYQTLLQNVDIFGRPPKRFYIGLADFATDPNEKKALLSIGGLEGSNEFKRRAEVDTITYADVLAEFPSARPAFPDLVRLVDPLKRREYSIASCQAVTPSRVALMVVTVGWTDPLGRARAGLATRYLCGLRPFSSSSSSSSTATTTAVTVSVKASVMKLPPRATDPLILAGLGTGLAPFRAFVQHRALQAQRGEPIGPVLLYLGARHRREEFCYGEEWTAYVDAGVISLLGCAFSRDQARKIYIQDRMRETREDIIDAYLNKGGSFYLCGPTWPVPDVQAVLEAAVEVWAERKAEVMRRKMENDEEEDDHADAMVDPRDIEEKEKTKTTTTTTTTMEKKKIIKRPAIAARKVDGKKEIERLKDVGRYVLEVY